MRGSSTGQPVTFADAARVVIRRLWLRKALQWMMRTLPFTIAGLLLLIVLRLLGVAWCGPALALTLTVLWAAGCFARAWWHKPPPYAAFAFWDARAARGDAFANAWWFEAQPRRSEGQEFHLRAQSDLLPRALGSLKRDIVLPGLHRLTALPVLLIAMILLPGGKASRLPDAKLSEEGRRLSEREGKKLAAKKLDAEKMKALGDDEKQELEKLQQKLAETAKALEQQKRETARGVLSELEQRARDAEKLAEKLAAGGDAWASEQMVAEMRRHADTAEIGDAVANKSTANTAKEAQKLADRLRDEKLAGETRDRIADTLKDIGKQSQPEDKERTVGQHVIAADKDMAQALPKDAGIEFQRIADKMRALAAREKAREELEKLAQQLRDAGSKVAGEGAQGMQALAGSDQGGQSGQSGQAMTMMQNAPQTQPMQQPGMSNAQQGQGQGGGQNMQTLQPSTGDGKDGKNLALAPPGSKPGDKGDGKDDKPMLFAPVPGQSPDKPPDGAIIIAGPPQAGGPPGTGTAKMGGDPTKATKAGQQSVVNAQRNAEGASAVRQVEGGVHNEQVTRMAQSTVLDAIKAEENALDDAALPPARREQVRRYFNELRKSFEKEN